MLESIRARVHGNHVIKAIAFYERPKGDCCLLFPWAERGTLREFWEEEAHAPTEKPTPDPQLVLWLFQQLHGLMEAVKLMHDQGIRHGDLKPDNILCFPDPS